MTSAFAGKFFPRVVIVAAVFAVAAALLALGWGRGSDSAQARHGPGTPAVIFGFDMDTANVGTAGIGGGAEGRENPAVAGQTCNDGIDNAGSAAGIDGADPACQGLGNTSTTLGPIDACRSVPAGVQTDFLFDTFLDGIPAAAPNLAGFGYTIEFPEAAGGIIQTQAHATPGTTILQPNIPLSEVVPDPPGAAGPVGQHLVSEAALGPAPTAGPEVGVVGRYTFRVTAGMAAGTYSLTVLPGTLTLGNSTPADWWATLGTDIIDGYGTGVDGYPSAGAYGIIAVGVPCPTPHDIKITSQNLWDKEVLPNPPGPPIYNCLVGVPPPSNINVSTQEWICVEKTIHNNGPTPQQVLIEKTVDASDPGVPGNDTEVSVHITDPQQVVDIAGGVPYGHKIDTNGDTVPDTVVMDGVGPASLTGLPPSTVIIALNAGVPDEIKLSEKVILQPSIPVTLEENFDVHCEGPSDHTFKISNKISLTDPFGQDPNTNNNTAQSVYNVSCIAQSDLKINTQTITATDPNGPPYIGDDGYDNDGNNGADEDGAGDCNGDGNPNDDGDLAIDEDGGDCMTIAVAKDIHNNGGYGPTDYSIVKSITALNGGLGYPFAASLQCVFTPLPGGDPLTGSLTVSNTFTHDESWVMNCPQHGYLVDDDGDSPDGACIPGAEYAAPNCQNYVDEDKPDGLDNDGDGKFDEDGPVSIEIVMVQNQISVDPDSDGDTQPDNHIVDPTPTNNIKVTTKPLTDYRPFNPSFTTFQDDVDPDIQVSPGPSIDCLITLPCKMAFNYSIPGGNPLANTILASPKPAFTFTRAPGFDKVGKITALATIDPSGLGTCSVTLPAIIDLMNGALPATGGFNEGTLIAGTGGAYTPKAMLPGQLADDATDLGNTDAQDGVDEDPPDFLGAGGISTDQDGDTRIDEDDASAVLNFMSWSKHLDAEVLAVNAGFPGSNLILRKVGFVDVVGTLVAINILVFDSPNAYGAGIPGYLEVAIIGDRDGDGDFLIGPVDPDDDNDGIPDYSDPNDDNDTLPDTLETAQCTPLTVSLIELGKSANNPMTPGAEGGATLQVCNTINTFPGHTFAAHFTRADLGTVTTKTHQQTCSGENDVSQTLAADMNAGNGVAAPQAVDDDGDTLVDEDPAGGGDDDGDSRVDEDGPGDPNGLPVGVTVGLEVDVTITNGNVPSAVNEELSIVSKDPCVAEWDVGSLGGDGTQVNVVLDPLITVGPTHISVLNWTEQGDTPAQMNANESVTVQAKYMLRCSAPSTQTLQIESHAESTPFLPDNAPLNNEAMIKPVINASNANVDGDATPNATDNCPFTAGPQTDSDGDGEGNVCDHDDDGDGFDDAVDQCPLLAEDNDGEGNGDGCPETDMSISVVKDNPIDVDVSENKLFTVTTTATNGNYGLFNPHGVIFFELLKSNVSDPNDKCVADWITQPGDLKVTDTVQEDFDADTDIDTVFMSQLQVTMKDLPPFNTKVKVRQYSLHCNARSDHVIFLEEGIAPTAPIQDPNVNNNVHKQYINIEAWDLADIKIVSYDVHSQNVTGQAVDGNGDSTVDCDNPADQCVIVDIETKKTLHNNGPAETNVFLFSSVQPVPSGCESTTGSDGSPTPPAGDDQFPSLAELKGIQVNPDGIPNNGDEVPLPDVQLSGGDQSTEISRSKVGATMPDIIDTEIVSMTLTAGGITLKAGNAAPAQPPSVGEIDTSGGFPAPSFFDVFYELNLNADVDGDTIIDNGLYNDTNGDTVPDPAHLEAETDGSPGIQHIPPQGSDYEESALKATLSSGAKLEVALAAHEPWAVNLPVSTQVVVFEQNQFRCNEPSDHHFSFSNEVEPKTVHVRDDDPSNNIATTSADVEIFGTTSLSVDVNVTHPAAEAWEGDLLRTIAPTPSGNGRAIAHDGHGKLYYTIYPDTNIYVVRVDGVAVRTLATVPAVQCGALDWDPTRGADGMLWCGSYDGTGNIYLINPESGAATLEFAVDYSAANSCFGAFANPYIDGLAYDVDTDTLWTSGDGARTILRVDIVTTPGGIINTVPVPAGQCNTGIEVQQDDMWLALFDENTLSDSQIVRVNKSDPSTILSSFAPDGGTYLAEDIALDDVNFTRCALWTNNATLGANELKAWGIDKLCTPKSEREFFDVTKTITNEGPFAVEPEVWQTLRPTGDNAKDCDVSFHVTAPFLASIVGGGQGLTIVRPIDDDGDSLFDEDPVDGIDNDLDTQTDEDPPNPVNPPTPAGWEPSDVVIGDPGGPISIHYQVAVDPHEALILDEEWDKHCAHPSKHHFELTTEIMRNPAKDPHVDFDTVLDEQSWGQHITTQVDLKIVDWFFEAPAVPVGPGQTVVQVRPSNWIFVNQKEKLHNNGPNDVEAAKKIIAVPTSAGCGVSYEVNGNEDDITINGVSIGGLPPVGTDIQVQYPDFLDVHYQLPMPVSVDVWETERWDFEIDPHVWECQVDFHKKLQPNDPHVGDSNYSSNYAFKTMTVCADSDLDGVPDKCSVPTPRQDNCGDAYNPGQQDGDGDGLGDACDKDANHDLVVKYCIKLGPAPINISDTQGHYMWALCDIGNHSDHNEVVTISQSLGAMPAGCTVTPQMILPGQSSILLQGQWIDNDADTQFNEDPPDGLDNDGDSFIDEDGPDGEQKIILFRTRFECHSTTPALVSLPVEICASHSTPIVGIDDDGDTDVDEDPVDGLDNDGDSRIDEDPPNDAQVPPDCHSQIEQVIIDQP